jgi:hypothetical protein
MNTERRLMRIAIEEFMRNLTPSNYGTSEGSCAASRVRARLMIRNVRANARVRKA